jgi:uncharacterized protein
MALPLMPNATAVWLVENTVLTFDQIAEFCGMHPLEVQAIADDEVAIGVLGLDPITNGQLTTEEIERCATDAKQRLKMAKPTLPLPQSKPKGARYTPVSKRQDRPDAIAWILKNYPELSDAQISRLIGTTKPTINAVREKTHWNTSNIKPQNPIPLGLCSEADLEKSVNLARARAGTVHSGAKAPDTTYSTETSIEKAAAGVTKKTIEEGPPAPEEIPTNETAEAVFGAAPKVTPPPTTNPESVETVFGTSATAPAPAPEPESDESKPSPDETPSGA